MLTMLENEFANSEEIVCFHKNVQNEGVMSEPESYLIEFWDFVVIKMNASSLFNIDLHVVSMLHVVSIHNHFLMSILWN